jgi:hypothetical protein
MLSVSAPAMPAVSIRAAISGFRWANCMSPASTLRLQLAPSWMHSACGDRRGGTNNGPPGLPPKYHAQYCAAFVRDPDGYTIETIVTLPSKCR